MPSPRQESTWRFEQELSGALSGAGCLSLSPTLCNGAGCGRVPCELPSTLWSYGDVNIIRLSLLCPPILGWARKWRIALAVPLLRCIYPREVNFFPFETESVFSYCSHSFLLQILHPCLQTAREVQSGGVAEEDKLPRARALPQNHIFIHFPFGRLWLSGLPHGTHQTNLLLTPHAQGCQQTSIAYVPSHGPHRLRWGR